jgi:pimeloyl-ACP methyl ester carboxylesterase
VFRKLSPYHTINRYVDWIFRRNDLALHLAETGNFRIEYWDNHKNLPVLLLLPAFAADTKFSWFRQIGALQKKFRLIVPNLVYFGNSTMLKKSFHIHDQVAAMNELITHLGIRKLSVCGASYGAIIGAEFAMSGSVKINKLVLTNAPYMLDQGEWHFATLREFNLEKKSDLLVPCDPVALGRLFNLTYYRKPWIPLFVFKDLYRYLYEGKTADKKNLIDVCIADLEAFSTREYQFDFPVLLLWGKADKLVSTKTAELLLEKLGPLSELTVIERTAHMPNLEKPRLYNRNLLQFLTR